MGSDRIGTTLKIPWKELTGGSQKYPVREKVIHEYNTRLLCAGSLFWSANIIIDIDLMTTNLDLVFGTEYGAKKTLNKRTKLWDIVLVSSPMISLEAEELSFFCCIKSR